MSDTLHVQWTITPQTAPQPWLNCVRCGGPRPFRSSGKVRANVNGQRLDAWLIYKCTTCDSTWNRPILERRPVEAALPTLRRHESGWQRRLEFDAAALRRHAGRIEQFDDVVVSRHVLTETSLPVQRMEILCVVPEPTGLRLDRLLASELHLPRSRLQDLAMMGGLIVVDEGPRALRKPVRDGLRIRIDLAASHP
jgi:hypothetical protein